MAAILPHFQHSRTPELFVCDVHQWNSVWGLGTPGLISQPKFIKILGEIMKAQKSKASPFLLGTTALKGRGHISLLLISPEPPVHNTEQTANHWRLLTK